MSAKQNGYPVIPTSAEVWAVLRARHGEEMDVFSSFSDPSGTFNGAPGEVGRMETTYSLKGSDQPFIAADTTWRIVPGDFTRHDLITKYWLFLATKEEA